MRRPLTLRTWVALVVVAPLLTASLILLTLTALSTHRIAEDMGRNILSDSSDRVRLEVVDYLAQCQRVSERYAEEVSAGRLPVTGLTVWERDLWNDIRTQPEVASICFANPQGETTWLLRERGALQVGRVAHAGAAQHKYSVNAEGRPGSQVVGPPYDATQRDWYRLALSNPQPSWTGVYPWYADEQGDGVMGSGYTRAIRRNGELLGVLVVDVTLSALSARLAELPLVGEHGGHLLLVDDQDLLVANSVGKPNAPDGRRVALADLGDPIGPLLADELRRKAEPRVRLANGEFARVRVNPLDVPGMHWRVITVLPEAAFLDEANAHRNHVIIAGAIVMALSIGLGLLVARYLSRPLLRLSGFVRSVGAGAFEARIELNQARELQELSHELNRMSAGLKQRMELEHSMRLATEVQQSLLPSVMPTVPGLDIAGHSRYCDETGGDYFDFIDVVPVGGGQVLIAVGDVTGHGIASALLMATARAAVRVSAAEHENLGRIMTNVNDILARDEHGRFMTLCLLVIDRDALTARYASAGHDAPIIYYPDETRFEELKDGEFPLGAIAGAAFNEHRFDQLRVGNLIVIGTDGIWEARNEAGDMYGKDRLRDLMRRHARSDAATLARAIDQSVDAFRGTQRVLDDITYVVVRVV